MKLFFSGRSFKLDHETPIVRKIKRFLDETQDGELLSTFQVSSALKCSYEPLRAHNGRFVGYFHVWRNKKYWGKKATITQFKKEIARNGNN